MIPQDAGRASDEIEDLEDLFEHAPCGYISAASNGQIARVNTTFARWLGFDRDALIGRRFQDLLSIAGRIFYETHFAPLMRMQGFFNEVALDLVCADGSTLPVLANAVERRDRQGRLHFVRIIIFNASDRRRYERELLAARRVAETANRELLELNRTLEHRVAEAVEARLKSEDILRQAQKMEAVGQLTGGIAHDFNNMLAVVLSALSLIERRLNRGEDVGKFIAAAKDGANRAAALTRRLLAFSRQQALSPQPLNANEMVSDMFELLHSTLGETVRLDTVLADDLWQVFADRNQLENAVINLAVNARDAMPEGGHLTIETANCHLDEAHAAELAMAQGQYVTIAVTDTGKGMTPEVATKAFEPFFTTKPVGKGTGLGLSQVFGFVKQSNGHIDLHSEVGRGTKVKIYLPRLSGATEAPKCSTGQDLAVGSELILVVEDDDQVRQLTAEMLRDLGYSVLEARGGAEALESLASHPDVRMLIVDVVMPDMSGRQLAETALKQRPDIKVLFATGYARNAIGQNGLLDRGVNLIRKPWSLHQLSEKVRSVLDS